MRKSTLTLLLFSAGIISIALTALDAVSRQDSARESLDRRSVLVKDLGLSDLALFTEARYTRHITLADRHSAFQDHPTSFEHFPTGSILTPPSHLSP